MKACRFRNDLVLVCERRIWNSLDMEGYIASTFGSNFRVYGRLDLVVSRDHLAAAVIRVVSSGIALMLDTVGWRHAQGKSTEVTTRRQPQRDVRP